MVCEYYRWRHLQICRKQFIILNSVLVEGHRIYFYVTMNNLNASTTQFCV